MNKFYKSLMLIFVLFAGLALADVEINDADNKITFDVDYNDFSDDDQEFLSESITVTLDNNGAENETVKVLIEELDDGYTYDNVEDKLVPAGESLSVTININVPHKNENGEKTIGQVVIKSEADVEIDRVAIEQSTKSMLEFKEIEIDYVNEDGNNENEDFDPKDDDSFDLDEKVRIGSEVTLTLKFENLFDRDYDDRLSALEKIEITIEADDNDLFDSDFEEDYDLPDIDAQDSDELTVSFNIDEDADAGDYTLEFTIIAEDGNNVDYEINKELNIEVQRDRNDIRIIRSNLVPSTVQVCEETTITVDSKIKNFGTRDQKYAALTLYNQRLGLDIKEMDILIEKHSDRDNTYDKNFHFTVDKDTVPGKYPLVLRTYVNRDDLVDDELIELTVEKCPVASGTNSASDNGSGSVNTQDGNQVIVSTIDTQGNEVVVGATTGDGSESEVIESVEGSYSKDDIIIASMIIGIVLIIIFIVLLVILLMRKP
jgi:uncharacterized membrane protein